MSDVEKEKLQKDILVALVTAVFLFASLTYSGMGNIILQSIEAFNSTITTLLGLLFTILAIIYTFESQFEDNKAVKVLKETDQYVDIIKIFFYTVAVLGIVWLYTFTLTIFGIHSHLGNGVQLSISFLGIWGFFAVIFRLWRCFWIFVKLNDAVNEYK